MNSGSVIRKSLVVASVILCLALRSLNRRTSANQTTTTTLQPTHEVNGRGAVKW